jgi:hypothetical protein
VAVGFTANVIIVPLVSAVSNLELAVSHDGVIMAYLTVPLDALTRY